MLKKVHVEGEQVRVIIDKTNYHQLFRSAACREVIEAIIEQNDVKQQQAQARKNDARKAKTSRK